MDKTENPAALFIKRIQSRLQRVKNNLSELIWIRFLLALVKKIGKDDVSNLSASIAYYAFLSLFPLLLSILFIMSLILPPESVLKQLEIFFSQFVPESPALIISGVQEYKGLQAAVGAIGIIGLLWAATGVFSAAANAINRAWDIHFRHPFYIRKPREILLVFGTGLLFLLSFACSSFLTMLSNLLLPVSGIIVNLGTIVTAFLLSALVFILVYKLLPAAWVNWRHIWPGALLATCLFEVAITFFVMYINTYHSFTRTYGSLASIVIMLVWIYYSAFILLLGAEFNALRLKMKREGDSFDKTEEKPDILREM